MPVMMIMELEGTTTDDYDAVNEAIGIDQDHLPDGLVSHAVGPTDDGGGLLIVDVWESPEQLEPSCRRRSARRWHRWASSRKDSHGSIRCTTTSSREAGRRGNVILLIESDTFTPEMYDDVTSRMPAHEGDGSGHPAVTHIAALTDDGMVFVDVWDSPESAQSFFESQLAPAADGVDMGPIEPKVVPVHNSFAAKS